jgi:glycine/D-amino acid oxidase-like deaminating enzyme
MEASHRAGRGERVLLIERDSRLGGVWKTGPSLGVTGVETTPHIFLQEPSGYTHMRRLLPATYAELDVQPRLFVRRSRYLGSRVLEIDHTLGFLLRFGMLSSLEHPKDRARKRLRRFAGHVARSLWVKMLSPGAMRCVYPARGLNVWFEEVEQHLRSAGVQLLTGCEVSDVNGEGEKAIVRLTTGREYRCTALILNGHANLRSISADGVSIPLDYGQVHSHHFTFAVKDQPPLGFAYFFGDPDLLLANDVTSYSEDFRRAFPGHRLITARASSHEEKASAASHYFERLKAAGYLDAGSVCVDSGEWHLTQVYLSRRSVRRIDDALGHRARVLVTDDLGITISAARRFARRFEWSRSIWRFCLPKAAQ